MPTRGLLPRVHRPNESVKPYGPDIKEAEDETGRTSQHIEHPSSFNEPIKLLKLVKHV